MITLADEYTVALGVTAVAAYIVSRLLVPPSLVHPLLLGRQSHVAAVRKEGESTAYTNYGIGSSQLPVAPGRGVSTQLDLLGLHTANANAERWLWGHKITNAQLKEKIAKIGPALCSMAGLVPKASRVLMLLDDSLEWLIADLALASHCVPTITISSAVLLHAVIESHPPDAILVQATHLEPVLEVLEESGHTTTVIVTGDRTGESKKHAHKVNTKIVTWEDVETFSAGSVSSIPPVAGDISTAHFYTGENGVLRGAQFTHQNIVAGANAVINIFPTTQPWSEKDTVISTHGLYTPFGRSIMYAALYTGSNFTTVPSSCILGQEAHPPGLEEIIRAAAHEQRPPPTVLFISPSHLTMMTTSILRLSKLSFLFWLAWQHKQSALHRGYLVRDSLWDRLVFANARADALGNVSRDLRAVCVAGGLHLSHQTTDVLLDSVDSAAIVPARIALSVPIVNAYPNPLSTGPIFASHPLDMQVIDTATKVPSESDEFAPIKMHTGAPTCNIEVKLLKIDEKAVLGGADPDGELCIRGPGVGDPIPMGVQLEDGWVDSGVNARVRPNGTFIIGAQRARVDASTYGFTLV